MSHMLSADTQAILLLTGNFGKTRTGDAVLSQSEYHRLALWLHSHQLRPGDMLQPGSFDDIRNAGGELLFDLDRLSQLLGRGAELAMIVEHWANKGLWILSRSDTAYPQRIKARLASKAPPILYGVGNQELLSNGGLAIVGSRDIDEKSIEFSHSLAKLCAKQSIQVVSGGARGVDSESMRTALEYGGTVVGILADSLSRWAVAKVYRDALRSQNLALVSPYYPDAGFNVGNAMSRNKYIYCLSDYALVVSTSAEKGGTWAGAVENLSGQKTPLFIQTGDGVPKANQKLLEIGGIGFHNTLLLHKDLDLTDWFSEHADPTLINNTVGRENIQHDDLPLEQAQAKMQLSEATTLEVEPRRIQEEISTYLFKVAKEHPVSIDDSIKQISQRISDNYQNSQLIQAEYDLFPKILPSLMHVLKTAKTEREVAELLCIELGQAYKWLQRAVDEGLVQKLAKPRRYLAHTQTQFKL